MSHNSKVPHGEAVVRLIVFALACLVISQECRAALPSASMSMGYAHAFLPSRNPGLPRDGLFINADWMFRVRGVTLPRLDAPLWVGFGGTFSYYGNTNGTSATIDGQQVDGATVSNYLSLFLLGPRVEMPIRLGRSRRFFITPELDAGGLLDLYAIHALGINDQTVTGPDHVGGAFALQPTLRAGYSWGQFAAGGEVSYLAAWGDFGRLGAQLQELHAGVFIRFSF